MIIVLDTSAAIEILLRDESKDYKNMIAEADAVIAPKLYISEMTNVSWKYGRIAKYKHELCRELAEDGINLIDQFIDEKDLWKEALREALNNEHPVYDCMYIVCARRNDATLLTMDKKLKKLCKKLVIAVR